MSNLATYKLKKMQQLESQLERSSRLVETIDSINKMKGGTTFDDLNSMIGKMSSDFDSQDKEVTGEFVISESQLQSVKTFIDDSKKAISELVGLAKKAALSQGSKQYKEVPKDFMDSIGLPTSLMNLDTPTSEVPTKPAVESKGQNLRASSAPAGSTAAAKKATTGARTPSPNPAAKKATTGARTPSPNPVAKTAKTSVTPPPTGAKAAKTAVTPPPTGAAKKSSSSATQTPTSSSSKSKKGKKGKKGKRTKYENWGWWD